jgi:hypothetical protein
MQRAGQFALPFLKLAFFAFDVEVDDAVRIREVP